MASWTLEEAQSRLSMWLEAEEAVSTGQSYKVGSRAVTRANLKEIADRIKFWRNEVMRLENERGTGVRVKRIVPRDL